jgi:DNA-binding NarL/FixJ family response regulator
MSSLLWTAVGLAGAALLFLLKLLEPLLQKDMEEGVPWLAAWVVRRAARKLPAKHQRRFEEEWLAELTAVPGVMVFKLRFALGVSLRARSTSRAMQGLLLSAPAARMSAVRRSVRLVLADDHQVFAEGLGVMLEAEDDLAVLGVAHDSHQAIELAARHEPAVLLLDVHMPGPDLATTLRSVHAASPATKVLILSLDTRRETITEALEAGADGFLAKDASSRQVAGAIRTLVDGKGSVVAAAAGKPASRPVRDPSVELRLRTLSAREREILGLLANGWSNRRIAEECFLSLNTVRTQVQNVLVKLGVHSKLEAVAFALEHQVVTAGTSAPAWASPTEHQVIDSSQTKPKQRPEDGSASGAAGHEPPPAIGVQPAPR